MAKIDLTQEQAQLLHEFTHLTGLGIVGVEAFERGELSFTELWQMQLNSFQGVADSVDSLDIKAQKLK